MLFRQPGRIFQNHEIHKKNVRHLCHKFISNNNLKDCFFIFQTVMNRFQCKIFQKKVIKIMEK